MVILAFSTVRSPLRKTDGLGKAAKLLMQAASYNNPQPHYYYYYYFKNLRAMTLWIKQC